MYLFTSERYCAGVMTPVAKRVKVVTNLPKIRSINGSIVPEATAAMNAMILSVQLSRSAYLKTRCAVLGEYSSPRLLTLENSQSSSPCLLGLHPTSLCCLPTAVFWHLLLADGWVNDPSQLRSCASSFRTTLLKKKRPRDEMKLKNIIF